MAVNGDVIINCRDGLSFGNGRFGCNSTFEDYVLARARRCVRLVTNAYTDNRDYIAPVLLGLAVFQLVGLRYERIIMPCYAFSFEFFFGLMLMVVSDAPDGLAVSLAAALAVLVAILCFFQGNIVGRVVIGLSLALILGIPILVIADAGVSYTSLGVLGGLFVVCIVFAKWSKPASLITLMCVTELVIVCLGISAFLDNGSLFQTVDDPTHAAITFIVGALAAIIVVPLNYKHWSDNEKALINQRLQNQHARLLRGAFNMESETMTPVNRYGTTSAAGSPSASPGSRRGEYSHIK